MTERGDSSWPSEAGSPLGETRLEGCEEVWDVRLADGSFAVFARLRSELAEDESIRRRYVRDIARTAAIRVESLAPILAVGPRDAPLDPRSEPPWRLRAKPDGESLESWLVRGPHATEEIFRFGSGLATALATLHAERMVLRDFHPRQAVLKVDHQVVFTDVGLARIDLLSSRTASSLVLKSSAYASPEQMRRITVDARSDVFAFGVVLQRAILGGMDDPARTRLGELARRCTATRPEDRPFGARQLLEDLAAIRGGAQPEDPLDQASVRCQVCGGLVPRSMRLCLRCGQTAVQLAPESGPYGVVLKSLRPDAESAQALREALLAITEGELPALDFMLEDHNLYSKADQQRLRRLPIALFVDLSATLAAKLMQRLFAVGLDVAVADCRTAHPDQPSLDLSLRRGRDAPPPSDPLVLRFRRHVQSAGEDLAPLVGQLALLVQEWVEIAAQKDLPSSAPELALLFGPLEQLVALIEKELDQIQAIHQQLLSLDEGRLVRALAVSRARKEPREKQEQLLAGLEVLRQLEDQRVAAIFRLLEVATLLARAVRMGKRMQSRFDLDLGPMHGVFDGEAKLLG